MNELILRVAAKACIINDEGKVLILREASSGKDVTNAGQWGLVGGRIESGEAFMDGLAREVAEETGLVVEPIKPLHVGEWRPVIRDVPYQIIAIFMLCKVVSGELTLSDEHDEHRWIDASEVANYEFMQPDDIVVRSAYL